MKRLLFLLAVIFLLSPPVQAASETYPVEATPEIQSSSVTAKAPARSRRAVSPAPERSKATELSFEALSASDLHSQRQTSTQDQLQDPEANGGASAQDGQSAKETKAKTEEAEKFNNQEDSTSVQQVLPISEQQTESAKIIVNITGGTLNLLDGSAVPESVGAGEDLDTMILPSKGCVLPESVSILENGSAMDTSRWGFDAKTGEISIKNIGPGTTITIQINCAQAVPAVFKTAQDPEEKLNIHKEISDQVPVEETAQKILSDGQFREATLHKAYLFTGVGCLLVAAILIVIIGHVRKNDKEEEEKAKEGVTIYTRGKTAV